MTDHPNRPDREAVATAICRDVAELPDRTSSEDQPDMMLVTHDELEQIVGRHTAVLSLMPEAKPWRRPDYDDLLQGIIDIIQNEVDLGSDIEGHEWLEGADRAAEKILAFMPEASGWRDQAEALYKMLALCLDRLVILEGDQGYQKHPREVLAEAQAMFEAPTPDPVKAAAALKSIERLISYPVATEINPKGYDLRPASKELLEAVYEAVNGALRALQGEAT